MSDQCWHTLAWSTVAVRAWACINSRLYSMPHFVLYCPLIASLRPANVLNKMSAVVWVKCVFIVLYVWEGLASDLISLTSFVANNSYIRFNMQQGHFVLLFQSNSKPEMAHCCKIPPQRLWPRTVNHWLGLGLSSHLLSSSTFIFHRSIFITRIFLQWIFHRHYHNIIPLFLFIIHTLFYTGIALLFLCSKLVNGT